MTLDDFKNSPRTMYIASEYERILASIVETKDLLEDESMKEMAEGELLELHTQKENLWKQMEDTFEKEKEEASIPKALIMEVQAGAGGDEATLFAAELTD